jgi:tripartite-type tricarboxylate transporter receptor subunit TctC
MSLNSRYSIRSLIGIAGLLLLPFAAWPQANDFYAGRTVTILVGSSPGGITDVSAREIARFLERHIPGEPTVIVKNMPGGGSVTMTNYLYRSAPKDGTVLGYALPAIVTAQLLEPRRARYDGREVNWIGSAFRTTNVLSVSSSAPVKTLEEARQQPVAIGVTGRGSPIYQLPALSRSLLGLQLRIIAGYEGGNDITLAMERGEVHGQGTALEFWAMSRPQWLESGALNHLVYIGAGDPQRLPGVPHMKDLVSADEDKRLVEFFETSATFGFPLFAPPSVPQERIAVLRQAFADVVADTEFAESVRTTMKMEISPTVGASLEQLIEEAIATPEPIVARARAVLEAD